MDHIDGPIGVAAFYNPQYIAVAGNNVYVTEPEFCYIRRIRNGRWQN